MAAINELRFEVSKHAALAFWVYRMPDDLHQLARQLSARHKAVGQQQTHRLDVAYSCLAAAANAEGSLLMPLLVLLLRLLLMLAACCSCRRLYCLLLLMCTVAKHPHQCFDTACCAQTSHSLVTA